MKTDGPATYVYPPTHTQYIEYVNKNDFAHIDNVDNENMRKSVLFIGCNM